MREKISENKMEDLNSDSRISILKNLKGKDIINVCKTSRKLNKICTDIRYDPLWRLKIMEEFNIKYNGKNAFLKYQELDMMYNQDIYTVISYYDGDPDYDWNPVIFDTLEKAVQYVYEYFKESFETLYKHIDPERKNKITIEYILRKYNDDEVIEEGEEHVRIIQTKLRRTINDKAFSEAFQQALEKVENEDENENEEVEVEEDD